MYDQPKPSPRRTSSTNSSGPHSSEVACSADGRTSTARSSKQTRTLGYSQVHRPCKTKLSSWSLTKSGLGNVTKIANAFRSEGGTREKPSATARSESCGSEAKSGKTADEDSQSIFHETMNIRLGLPFKWCPAAVATSQESSGNRPASELLPELRITRENVTKGYAPPLPPWKYTWPSFLSSKGDTAYFKDMTVEFDQVRNLETQFNHGMMELIRQRSKPASVGGNTWTKEWIQIYVDQLNSVLHNDVAHLRSSSQPIRIFETERLSRHISTNKSETDERELKHILALNPVYNPRKMMLHIISRAASNSFTAETSNLEHVPRGIFGGIRSYFQENINRNYLQLLTVPAQVSLFYEQFERTWKTLAKEKENTRPPANACRRVFEKMLNSSRYCLDLEGSSVPTMSRVPESTTSKTGSDWGAERLEEFTKALLLAIRQVLSELFAEMKAALPSPWDAIVSSELTQKRKRSQSDSNDASAQPGKRCRTDSESSDAYSATAISTDQLALSDQSTDQVLTKKLYGLLLVGVNEVLGSTQRENLFQAIHDLIPGSNALLQQLVHEMRHKIRLEPASTARERNSSMNYSSSPSTPLYDQLPWATPTYTYEAPSPSVGERGHMQAYDEHKVNKEPSNPSENEGLSSKVGRSMLNRPHLVLLWPKFRLSVEMLKEYYKIGRVSPRTALRGILGLFRMTWDATMRLCRTAFCAPAHTLSRVQEEDIIYAESANMQPRVMLAIAETFSTFSYEVLLELNQFLVDVVFDAKLTREAINSLSKVMREIDRLAGRSLGFDISEVETIRSDCRDPARWSDLLTARFSKKCPLLLLRNLVLQSLWQLLTKNPFSWCSAFPRAYADTGQVPKEIFEPAQIWYGCATGGACETVAFTTPVWIHSTFGLHGHCCDLTANMSVSQAQLTAVFQSIFGSIHSAIGGTRRMETFGSKDVHRGLLFGQNVDLCLRGNSQLSLWTETCPFQPLLFGTNVLVGTVLAGWFYQSSVDASTLCKLCRTHVNWMKSYDMWWSNVLSPSSHEEAFTRFINLTEKSKNTFGQRSQESDRWLELIIDWLSDSIYIAVQHCDREAAVEELASHGHRLAQAIVWIILGGQDTSATRQYLISLNYKLSGIQSSRFSSADEIVSRDLLFHYLILSFLEVQSTDNHSLVTERGVKSLLDKSYSLVPPDCYSKVQETVRKHELMQDLDRDYSASGGTDCGDWEKDTCCLTSLNFVVQQLYMHQENSTTNVELLDFPRCLHNLKEFSAKIAGYLAFRKPHLNTQFPLEEYGFILSASCLIEWCSLNNLEEDQALCLQYSVLYLLTVCDLSIQTKQDTSTVVPEWLQDLLETLSRATVLCIKAEWASKLSTTLVQVSFPVFLNKFRRHYWCVVGWLCCSKLSFFLINFKYEHGHKQH